MCRVEEVAVIRNNIRGVSQAMMMTREIHKIELADVIRRRVNQCECPKRRRRRWRLFLVLTLESFTHEIIFGTFF